MSKEVKKQESKEISTHVDYSGYENAGYENQSASDYTIPYIGVLQALSPQLETLPNAKAGMLVNSVTNELYDGKSGFLFVPAITKHLYVEWVPKEAGGGLVGVHDASSDLVITAQQNSAVWNELKTPKGNDLVETFYMYGVILGEDEQPLGFCMIPFSSTKIKVYKKINTKLRTFTLSLADGRKIRPPLFAHKLRIASIKEKSTKGDYYNFLIEPAVHGDVKDSLIPVDHPAFLEAKKCSEMVNKGTIKIDDTTLKQAQTDTEEVPF